MAITWHRFWSILNVLINERPLPVLKKMADQVYMVYYQLMQESVNFTIETDPDWKEAIRQRIIALWRVFNLLLQVPVPGFQGFPPPLPPPPAATAGAA